MDLEPRILELALARGLLEASDLEGPVAAADAVWGPRLDALLARGRLRAEELRLLALEAMRSGSELACPDSWVEDSIAPAAPQEAEPELPPQDGRYSGLELLASGGTARVYRAFDEVLRRPVALKLLKDASKDQAEAVLEEARAQAQVEHPNICRVYEVGEFGGRPCIAMQLVTGRTLAHVGLGLSLEQRVRALRDVAEAVHAAHRRGLVHLDLKPGNILMEPAGRAGYRPLVADFGFHSSEDGGRRKGLVPLGTPPYSSPEQLAGDPAAVDRRSDVYSLGVVLFSLVAGREPYAGPGPGLSVAALREQLRRGPLASLAKAAPGTPRDLAAIAAKCMAMDKAERYLSALALAEDLQRFLNHEPVLARPAAAPYRALKWVRRHPGASAMAALALLLVAGWSAASWRSARRAELAQRFTAEVEEAKQLLRLSRMSPVHDTRPQVQELRERMDRIRSDMARLGGLARGPGAYALGLAHLSLNELEAAEAQFLAARRSGLSGPELDEAQGEALARRYIEASKPTTLLVKAKREALLQRLDAECRRPALALLKGLPSRSSYAEVWIAELEGRQEDALGLLRELQRRQPWRYEALLDTYYLLQRQFSPELMQRDPERAAQLDRELGELLQRAVATAPSDSVAQCLLGAWLLQRHRGPLLTGRERGDLDAAMEAYRHAAEADPGAAAPHGAICHLLTMKAQQPGTPEPFAVLDEAIREGETAVPLPVQDGFAWSNLADAYVARARLRAARGLDGREDLRRGIEAQQQAVAARQDMPFFRFGLGDALLALVEQEQRWKGNPQAPLSQARRLVDETLPLSANPAFAQLACRVSAAEAELQAASGADPAAALRELDRELAGASAWNWIDDGATEHLCRAQGLLARAFAARGAATRALAAAALKELRPLPPGEDSASAARLKTLAKRLSAG